MALRFTRAEQQFAQVGSWAVMAGEARQETRRFLSFPEPILRLPATP